MARAKSGRWMRHCLDPIEKLRLFVAVFPTAPIVEKLGAAALLLRKEVPANAIRWTQPAQIHVTLNFIGSVEAARVFDIESALEGACRGARGGVLRVAGLGCWPDASPPEILWAGLRGEVLFLRNLKEAIDQRLEQLGQPPEARMYRPHLTIARMKRLNPVEQKHLRDAILSLRESDFGGFRVERIHLVSSVVSPEGAKYTSINSFPLANSGA